MTRQTTTTTTELTARCHRCKWQTNAPNGLGNAARHHDATGHAITIHIARDVVYGDPAEQHPYQTSLPLEELAA